MAHPLDQYITPEALDALIARARDEDLGPEGVDVTCEAMVSADRTGEARMVPRAAGVLAGSVLLPRIAAAYDPRIAVTLLASDGAALTPGEAVARFRGPLRSILAMERVALNVVTHLSGIATLTARYVAQTVDTPARIYDTRKTLPGLRGLAKYAVTCGGGHAHRIGLYDAMLVKDNHLAGVTLDALPSVLEAAIRQARAAHPALRFVEVEVDTLAQLERVLAVEGVDVALLDNMDVAQLKEAVAMRDSVRPGLALEASGGVELQAVKAIAATGVDRIAVGALTHSAPALDLGLDIDEPA